LLNKTVLVVILLLASGCVAVSVSYNIKKEKSSQIESITSSKDKKIRLDIKLRTDERDVFEKGHANNKRNRFFDSMMYDIRKAKTLKSVHEKPTKVNEILLSRLYQDDYLLEVIFDEKILKEDHARFLRVITFGVVPERLEKELKFRVNLTDLKTGKVRSITKEYLVDMTISSLVLFIPYDFNMHPFSFNKQIEFYKSIILPDIYKLLSVEVPNEDN